MNSQNQISVNEKSFDILKELIEEPSKTGVLVKRLGNGATLIDAGIDTEGGFEAGLLMTEISMGGLASASLEYMNFEEFSLPSIRVMTDFPVISALGSQMGWVGTNSDFGIVSGPFRAMARIPEGLYETIGYFDESDFAVVVAQKESMPDEKMVEKIADKCNLEVNSVYVLFAPAQSIAGFVQICGRIIENGIYQLYHADGFDVEYAWGETPIPSVLSCSKGNSKFSPDDMIAYGGRLFLYVRGIEDKRLESISKEIISSSSEDYGKDFQEILEEAEYDFSKVDENFFAPAEVYMNNLETGEIYRAGRTNTEYLKGILG